MDYSSDPVLQREMFRPRSKAVKEDGIASVATPESDMARRKREAAALLEEARSAQDPSNFTTLDKQDKPAVFRPIAAQSAQAPQQNVLQQMQQMQAMGMRPVGMADGGLVPTIAAGSNARYTLPDVGLRMGGPGEPAITFGDGTSTPNVNTTSDTIGDPAEWTDKDIEEMAKKRLAEDPALRKAHEEYAAKTPFGRGIQSLNPFSTDPLEALIKDMKVQRAYSKADKGRSSYNESLLKGREKTDPELKAIVEAQKESPVSSIFAEVTPEKRAEELAAQEKAIQGKEDKASSATKKPVPEGNEADREFRRATSLGKMKSPDIAPAGETEREYNRATALSNMAAPTGIQTLSDKTPEEKALAEKAKEKTNTLSDFSTDLEQIKADRAAQRAENINLGIIQAGLAMAGGESQYALTNIAKGAASGLGAFADLEKQSRAENRQARQDLIAQQNAAREAAYREAALANQEKELGFKTGPEFEYLKSKAEEDRKARIDMAKERNITAAQAKVQASQTAIQAEIDRLTTKLASSDMMAASPTDRQAVQQRIQDLTRKMADNEAWLDQVLTANGLPPLTREKQVQPSTPPIDFESLKSSPTFHTTY